MASVDRPNPGRSRFFVVFFVQVQPYEYFIGCADRSVSLHLFFLATLGRPVAPSTRSSRSVVSLIEIIFQVRFQRDYQKNQKRKKERKEPLERRHTKSGNANETR